MRMRREGGKLWYQSLGIVAVYNSVVLLASFKEPCPFNFQKKVYIKSIIIDNLTELCNTTLSNCCGVVYTVK